jgi:hypothetical protein
LTPTLLKVNASNLKICSQKSKFPMTTNSTKNAKLGTKALLMMTLRKNKKALDNRSQR